MPPWIPPAPQRYLGTPCRVGRASQGLRRAPQKPRNSATRCLIPTGIPLKRKVVQVINAYLASQGK